MKKIITILFIILSLNSYAQIGISYSIGSLGAMKTSSFSSPLAINGVNCIKVSNGIAKFMEAANGNFYNECAVDLNYTRLNIKIAPNPVINYTTISFKDKVHTNNRFQIGIYNSVGDPVAQFETSQDQLYAGYRLDMTAYATGYYYIKVMSNNIMETFKIFKSNND